MHNRFWVIAYLAASLFFVLVEGKSLRHTSRESSQIISRKHTVLQRIRSHRQLQEDEEPFSSVDGDGDGEEEEEVENILESSTTASSEDEESILPLEANSTAPGDQEESSLQVNITTKAGEVGQSPFFFGTGDTGDENPSPFYFGAPQAEDGRPQGETEDIPPVNLNITEQPNGEGQQKSANLDTEQSLNETIVSPAQLDNEQPKEEYLDFHFGSGQIHQHEHSSNHMMTKESHQGPYVNGDLVDQFANMFNMVHVSSGHLPPPHSGFSSKGKGSIYYDEFDVHGKGGKGKGGTGSKSKGGKGGKNHGSDKHSKGSFDGSGVGVKLSKKNSSSGSKAYRRAHRLTMPPKESNSHGASSEKSRR